MGGADRLLPRHGADPLGGDTQLQSEDGLAMDKDGYPTVEELTAIREEDECNVALDLLRETWNTHYGSVTERVTRCELEMIPGLVGDCFLRLVTGGWSGNEDALEAFMENRLANLMTWRLSAAGGLHIFQYLGPAAEA